MIEIREIDKLHKSDINIPNEPFQMFGRMIPSYNGEQWTYELVRYERENMAEMCFPDEDYQYDAMADCVFLGAYDGERCIGLAILQPGFFKYMYLYDLKVSEKYRGRHIGKTLIEKAKEAAALKGYCGLYTQGQDNNPGACLFYLNAGFYIGGLDTNVYRHTKQEGKADILFYCEVDGAIPMISRRPIPQQAEYPQKKSGGGLTGKPYPSFCGCKGGIGRKKESRQISNIFNPET